MNPIARIAPVTDEEAARMARPETLSDLARQIAATPVATSRGASARSWAANRPRRLLLGVPLAAALAAAVVIVAGGVPGTRHNGTGGPAANAAEVVTRVDGALSAADPGAIAQMTVTTRGTMTSGGKTVTTTAEEWSYGDQWRSVTYSPTGHLVYDEGSTTASLYTLVSYPTRTWARQPGLGRPAAPLSGPQGCERVVAALPLPGLPGLPGSGFSASSLLTAARELRAAISCGTLAAAGRQRVDGIEAIKLTSRPDGPISETIWVGASTYLPVRVVISHAPGQPALRLTMDITWLPPAEQNLAKLAVPIPSGFRQVPLAEAVKPIMHRIRG